MVNNYYYNYYYYYLYPKIFAKTLKASFKKAENINMELRVLKDEMF